MKLSQFLKAQVTPVLWIALMTASPATAGQADPEIQPGGILSASDILAAVRNFGLDPAGPAVRRGPCFVLHAFDGTGAELRVVADARFGDILSIAPAFNAAITPPYVRAARIIQIPAESEGLKR